MSEAKTKKPTITAEQLRAIPTSDPSLGKPFAALVEEAGVTECAQRVEKSLYQSLRIIELLHAIPRGGHFDAMEAVTRMRDVSDTLTEASTTIGRVASFVYKRLIPGLTVTGWPRILRAGKPEYIDLVTPRDLVDALSTAKSRFAAAVDANPEVKAASAAIALAEKTIKEWEAKQTRVIHDKSHKLAYELAKP